MSWLTMRNVALHKSKYLLSTASLGRSSYRFGDVLCHVNSSRWVPYLQAVTKIHGRGAKSRATIPLRDLQHDGNEVRQPLEESKDDGPGYPTVVQQARNNMRKFENCVLLTRVGSFYEVHSLRYRPWYGR